MRDLLRNSGRTPRPKDVLSRGDADAFADAGECADVSDEGDEGGEDVPPASTPRHSVDSPLPAPPEANVFPEPVLVSQPNCVFGCF